MGEFFKWEYVVTLFPKVLSALPTTLLIVLFATLIGSFLGFILAYFRIERIPILHQLSAILLSIYSWNTYPCANVYCVLWPAWCACNNWA